MPKSDSLSPVSSREQNLSYAVANPKKVLPAASRAQKLALALQKSELDADLPQKRQNQKDTDTLAAMIRRKK